MLYRFPLRNIKDMLLNQISHNYFRSIEDEVLITKYMPLVLERLEKNISQNDNKYYSKVNAQGKREAYFDPLHTCQWLLFLYLMANTIYKNETKKVEAARVVCDKIYGQAKAFSGCDLYYEVEMPEIFSFDHPLGSIIGRGQYGNYFSFTEGCTVSNDKDVYPIIGAHVTMQSGSKIIGKAHIGDNCLISANTLIVEQDVPDNVIVSGKSPNLVFKKLCK